mgnify:CR=1 FL=1
MAEVNGLKPGSGMLLLFIQQMGVGAVVGCMTGPWGVLRSGDGRRVRLSVILVTSG